MPRRLRQIFEGAKYHVTVRGNGRAERFHTAEDRERFVVQLQEAAQRDGVVVYAYALMPNHYHLLVETPRGNLERFMQRLNTSYAMYYRHKHRRPGHCFQGRYGAKLVEGDEYLLRLTRYIHLNPVKIESLKAKSSDEKWAELERWVWSSWLGYVSKKNQQDWVDYRWRELAGGRSVQQQRRAYKAYLRGCLESEDEVLAAAYQRSLYAIGDEAYVQEVEESVRQEGQNREHQEDLALPPASAMSCREILRKVAKALEIEEGALRKRSRTFGDARRIAVELCCRWSGCSQRQVAKEWGLSEHAVGKQRKQLREKMREDKKLERKFYELLAQKSEKASF